MRNSSTYFIFLINHEGTFAKHPVRDRTLRKKEEGRRKKEEGRRKKEEGRKEFLAVCLGYFL
ncbi:MAG: hypothetical protein EAZ77_05520 [Nostocales cyanobacterium]|nr:MAG: hypothetical protein EAZ77_05520 [Nostocales cyanobacterium]